MVVSALVVTIDPRRIMSEHEALGAVPSLSVGEPVKNRIPVVAETLSSRAGRDLCQSLRNRDAVWAVDVVMVDFSNEVNEVSNGA